MNPIKRKILIFFWIACLIFAFSLLIPHPVYADDCLSDPFNAADCMRTPGFRPTIAVIISVGSTLVTILVSVLGGTATAAGAAAAGAAAGAATGAAGTAATASQPPAPQPLSPDDQYKQELAEKGWVWSEADDNFIPQFGATNDQNEVWCQPPWDKGGSNFWEKEVFDDIQEHLSRGDKWSDRWGWKSSEEINQLDQERDDNWNKFTDQEEWQERYDQEKQHIKQEVENSPEEQESARLKRESNLRIKKATESLNAAQMEQFDKEMERGDTFNTLLKSAKGVKSVADFGIDTLGMAPGAGRIVKYTYKFVSNTAETTGETGSFTKGLIKGVKKTGESFVADKLGDFVRIPGIKNPTKWAKIPVKTFVKTVTTSPRNAVQLALNKAKDSAASEVVERIEGAVEDSITDNSED